MRLWPSVAEECTSRRDRSPDHQDASVVGNDVTDRRKPEALTPRSTQAGASGGKHTTEQLPGVNGVER